MARALAAAGDPVTVEEHLTGLFGPLKPRQIPKGTSVLSCRCGIPWRSHHTKFDIITCAEHGITTVEEFR